MRRIIHILAISLLGLVLMVFTASNTGDVEIGLWPFPGVMVFSIYGLLFAGIFVGLLLAALVTAWDRTRLRWSLRQARKKIGKLESRLAVAEEAEAPSPQGRLLAIEKAQGGH